MFETNPKDLRDLLRDAHDGKLQLPDFQRSYVWSDEDVKSLIASIARGFPVGALLTLQSGSALEFAPRLIEGAPGLGQKPEQLLLDGQQRITSLYGALFSKFPMRTRPRRDARKTVQRYYYLDMAKAVEEGDNIEDAVIGVGADHRMAEGLRGYRHDFSSLELQFQSLAFPLNLIFGDQSKLMQWIMGCQSYHQSSEGSHAIVSTFVNSVLEKFTTYKMPVIRLDKSSTREAICLIFEKVNVGGKKLDAFELVTAIFAGHKSPLDLRADWWGSANKIGRSKRIVGGHEGAGNTCLALEGVANTDFLQSISLLHSLELRMSYSGIGDPPQVSCKRAALLALPLEAYRKFADIAEEGFRRAGVFLNRQGVLWQRDVPYPAQVVALATVFAKLGQKAQTVHAQDKLSIWFYRVALSEDFGSSTETKLAKDVPDLIRWIETGVEPDRLSLLVPNPARLDTLTSRLSAAYKAISALLLREGCRDFISGNPADVQSFYGQPLDIHHIFPQAWCRKHDGTNHLMDSIVNKTPISASSNRSIGGSAPSIYLNKIKREHKIDNDALGKVLLSHFIDPQHLHIDDFIAFYNDRKLRLIAAMSKATGLKLMAEDVPDEVSVDFDEELDVPNTSWTEQEAQV